MSGEEGGKKIRKIKVIDIRMEECSRIEWKIDWREWKKLVPISSRRKNMGLVIQTFTQNILFSRAFCFSPIISFFFKSNIKINTREK